MINQTIICNKRTWLWVSDVMLLIYNKNNTGPSTDTYGTPDETEQDSDCVPDTTTC